MKITVIGAGAIGSAVALDLNNRSEVRQVQICDTRARLLQQLHDKVRGTKLRSFQVDARDPRVLEPILHGSNCVVGCGPPELNPKIAELCLDLGMHFCDLGGNDTLIRKELALAERAERRSIWIVPNCGLAPGLVNVLCRLGIKQFDEVHAAHLRVGDVPLHPEPPFHFRISWSADKILDDYTNPVLGIEKGEVVQYEPLSHDERIEFGEPFGEMEAFCTAGGLSTLTEDLATQVRYMDHKTICWPGHANQMRLLIGLGFAEKRTIDVRTHLTYRDVLVRRMRQRLGGEYEDAVLMRVLIQGIKGRKKKTLVYEMIERFDPVNGLTAIQRCTSIPTASVACLIASKQVPGGGAGPAEAVVPGEAYCKMLEERGLRIHSNWYDGHVAVNRTAAP
jgi:saccharopine dehydrogenase-like NADP-dependent oxidoreductase